MAMIELAAGAGATESWEAPSACHTTGASVANMPVARILGKSVSDLAAAQQDLLAG